MKCLILAAGYATRLYPLTENFPKPLLEVKGKTILDWLVDDIDTSGLVDQYVVISNHKFVNHFEKWAANKKQNITVLDDGTSTNETRLGAVKDIQFAIDELKKPAQRQDNHRADGGHLDLQQSIVSCLLKTISTLADVCETFLVYFVCFVVPLTFLTIRHFRCDRNAQKTSLPAAGKLSDTPA